MIATDMQRIHARTGGRGARARRSFFAYLFMTPTVIVLAVVVVAPLFYSFYLSFHAYIVTYGLGGFIGFENYLEVFATDLAKVSWVTLKLTFLSVLLELLIAFGLALLLNQPRL